MWNFKYLIHLAVFSSLTAGQFFALGVQEKKKTITRVKRPDFSDSERNKIYFDDIFAEGLKGPKPEAKAQSKKPKANGANVAVSSSGQWSRVISRSALEDEIKIIHRELQSSITTPSAFNSKFSDVRHRFDMLSMLFGIVHQYDKEVRWQKFAGTFQQLLAEASGKIRTPSRPGFQLAKSTRDELGNLIRGGGIKINESIGDSLSWGEVIGRGPIMDQLDFVVGEGLKRSVSNKDEFKDNRDKILRNANLVSAMSRVLTMDGLDDSEDDDYVRLANRMGAAAKQLIDATQNNEFDAAAMAVNRIGQSCVDCHSEWRD